MLFQPSPTPRRPWPVPATAGFFRFRRRHENFLTRSASNRLTRNLEMTPMTRTTTILALAALLALPATLTNAGAATRPAAATTKPGTSDFSLTIYSTADPATFDPQQLAQQRLMN